MELRNAARSLQMKSVTLLAWNETPQLCRARLLNQLRCWNLKNFKCSGPNFEECGNACYWVYWCVLHLLAGGLCQTCPHLAGDLGRVDGCFSFCPDFETHLCLNLANIILTSRHIRAQLSNGSFYDSLALLPSSSDTSLPFLCYFYLWVTSLWIKQ